MNILLRVTKYLLIGFLACCVSISAAPKTSKSPTLNKLLNRARQQARQARFEHRTEKQLRQAITLYERVIEIDPDNTHALTRLSLGYFTLAEAYLTEPQAQQIAYHKGYEYGLRSLKTSSRFNHLWKKYRFSAFTHLGSSLHRTKALFWTATNHLRIISTKNNLAQMNDLAELLSMYRKVTKLDEDYMGGGAHRALGSIQGTVLKKLPWSLIQVTRHNFSWEKTRHHFERAIQLAPHCLDNYYTYAKYYALNRNKQDLARKLLQKIISHPVGNNYPLINMVAKKKAKKLLQNL